MHVGIARASRMDYLVPMVPRRAQTPITIRSDRAAARMKSLTRYGRSQAEVIEEALDQLPDIEAPEDFTPEQAERYVRLKRLIASIEPGSILTMKEFDALEYDEFGDLR